MRQASSLSCSWSWHQWFSGVPGAQSLGSPFSQESGLIFYTTKLLGEASLRGQRFICPSPLLLLTSADFQQALWFASPIFTERNTLIFPTYLFSSFVPQINHQFGEPTFQTPISVWLAEDHRFLTLLLEWPSAYPDFWVYLDSWSQVTYLGLSSL